MTPADLRAARQRLALTQAGLADRLGTDPRTIRRWEGGERAIPPYLALALAYLEAQTPPLRGST